MEALEFVILLIFTSAILSASSSSTASSTPVSTGHQRLPYDISVDRYWISLRPYLDETDGDRRFTFDGMMKANLSVHSSTDRIVLNAKNLSISEISVCDGACSAANWRLDSDDELLIIDLNSTAETGTSLELRVKYVGILNDELMGFYRSRYQENGLTRYIATTQMEPTGARQAFPCMDEPDRKSIFAIEIRCDKKYNAISNMPLKASSPVQDDGKDNTRLFQFEDSLKMSSYLVAFIVHDFDNAPAAPNTSRIKVQVWGRSKDLLSYAATTAAKVLSFYEDYFQIPYPLLDLKMAAIPDFDSGAMENWGLITYRETALQYNPATIGNASKQWTAQVISHELAHQWFGNLVTLKWWDDLWLNEAFAECIEYMGVEHVLPDVPMATQFQKTEVHDAFDTDALFSTRPVFQDVKTPDSINSLFDNVTYQKGSSLLRMLREFLGRSTFQKGLQRYLKKHAYGNAVGQDLWKELSAQAAKDGKPLDVAKIMGVWITQAGYPVVHVSAGKKSGIKVTQSRFFLDEHRNENTKKWDIPLTLSTQKRPQKNSSLAKIHWLRSNKSLLSLPHVDADSWLLLNVEQSGYYRVNYEDEMWRRLVRPSVLKQLPPANRAQLINDAMNLARAGLLKYDVALEVFFAILKTEENYYVWFAAFDTAKYVKKRLIDQKPRTIFSRMMSRSGLKIFKKMQRLNDEDWNISQLRSLMYKIHCGAKNKQCLDSVTKLSGQWRQSPKSLNPNIRRSVLCEAIRSDSTNLTSAVFTAYKTEISQVVAQELRRAASCSNDVNFLKMLLHESFSDGVIRKQDSRSTLNDIAGNRVGKALVWNYTRDNWDSAVAFLGKKSMGRLMSDMADDFDDEETLKSLRSNVSKMDLQGAARLHYEQAMEKISLNIAWKTKNAVEVGELVLKMHSQLHHRHPSA